MAGEVMQNLVKQGLIEIDHRQRIVEVNRQKGMVEYVDPLASIFHLVSPIPVIDRHLGWPQQYQNAPDDTNELPAMHRDAVQSLEAAFEGFALDIIRTHDSCGEEVIRYGYYPRLAAIQSRKRSASVVVDSQDGGAGGRSSKTPRLRKMSRSQMVCFDETSSETQTETVLESENEENMYN
jgi:hypothetical protein